MCHSYILLLPLSFFRFRSIAHHPSHQSLCNVCLSLFKSEYRDKTNNNINKTPVLHHHQPQPRRSSARKSTTRHTMGAGRFACVALPLALTIASIVCVLVAMLAGVTDKNLGLFEIETKNLSLSESSLENLIGSVTRRSPVPIDIDDILKNIDTSKLNVDEIVQKIKDSGVAGANDIAAKVQSGGKDALNNLVSDAKASGTQAIDNLGATITAKDLGLADYYRVSMWGYCSWTDGKRTCTQPQFDWASKELNQSSSESFVSPSGRKISLPEEMRGSLKAFRYVSKWTQIVYIVALVSTAVELVFGIFAICSRIGSCCTSIVCAIATTALIAASILATVQASVVVGAVKTSAKAYNVQGSLSTKFLGFTWAAVAFSLGAGLFWMFTTCCCGSDSKSSKGKGGWGKRSSHNDSEKLIPGTTRGYQRVGDDHATAYQGQSGMPMHSVQPHRTGAYEPYSHRV